MIQDLNTVIKNIQQGDEQAFVYLYQQYYKSAYAIAYKITQNDADAKEAVQEAFIQIHRSIQQLQNANVFYSWMSRIVAGKCVAIFRKNKNIPVDPEQIRSLHNQEERRYMLPNETYAFHNDQEVLLTLMHQLSPKLQEILYMAYFQELKGKEIAAILQISENTVKSRIRRGKEELKVLIEEYEKTEGRKLAFQVDTLIPLSVVSVSFFAKTRKVMDRFFTGNAVNVACAVSVSILATSGAAFVYQDHMIQPKEKDTLQEIETEERLPLQENNAEIFSTASYQEEAVTTAMDAYFICKNWAKTEEEIKHKSNDELLEIYEVYQSLKASKSIYYTRLEKENWVKTYESLLHINDIA